MRSLLHPFLVVLLVALAASVSASGCEAASEEGASPSATAPVITKFFFTPTRVYVDEASTFDCKVGFQDSDGDVEAIVLRIATPSGAQAPDQTIPATTAGQTSGELTFSFEATADEVGDYVFEVTLVDAAGQASSPKSQKLSVADYGGGDICGAQAVECEHSAYCYTIEPDTCDYLADHGLDYPECDDISSGDVPLCVSSLEDPQAEYAAESQCAFVQWWSNPTDLKADCRCGTSAVDVAPCKRPQDLPSSVQFGEGPRIGDASGGGFQDLGHGPVIGREWFLPVDWNNGQAQDRSVIFAVNLDTGDRRHVSGDFVSPTTGTTEVGSGDPLLEVYHLAKGPDGMLYGVGAKETLGEPKIWRIDPQSGARTLVYDAEAIPEADRCPNGNLGAGRKDLQLHAGSVAIDDAGHFYLSGTSTSLPGPAIVRIDAGTLKCDYVTGVFPPNSTVSFTENIGGGYDLLQFPFRGLLWHAGALYAISDVNLVEIDPDSGDRTLVSRAKSDGGLGSGPVANEGMGNFWTLWDPHHEVFWTVGGNIVVAIDPATGDRYAMPCWHPGTGLRGGLCDTTGRFVPGALERGGMVIDPEDPRHVYFAHDNVSVVKYDTQTANAVIHSL